MNMTTRLTLLCAALMAASFESMPSGGKQTPSLKDAFKNDFAIGTAMNDRQIEEKDSLAAALIPQQFNTVRVKRYLR